MHKLVFFTIIFLLVNACKQHKQEVAEDNSMFEISNEGWQKKSVLSSATTAIIKDWPEYVDLDQTFDGIYTVENTEDLKLIIDDLIEKQKFLVASEYPESFNKPEIKSRQKVFHTFVLKTKGDLDYRLDPQNSVKKMINAYNSLRNQFENISNNTLDIKTLLEE